MAKAVADDPAAAPAETVRELARIIGHEFAAPGLLREALTHPSALSAEHGRSRRGKRTEYGYERLEFLGDRVLGLVVAELLWRRFPNESEGSLTRRLAFLVCRETLAQVAQRLGLGPHLVLSRAERAAGAATNPAILSDACEAVLAAIYLDAGFAAAADFIRLQWEPLISAMEGPPHDPKTALQEWAQARGLGLPSYELVSTSGPDHAPQFTVAARVAGGEPITATASAKRAAEVGAAAALLLRKAESGQNQERRGPKGS